MALTFLEAGFSYRASRIITDTAISYERVDYATVETETKFWVNVESSQVSKNVQSLLRLCTAVTCSVNEFCIQHNTKVLE